MITNRQIEILRLIVDDFIEHGLPVGSRTLSKNPNMKFSPATIRNDMADLEEIGFIIQPHISAGRIPSERGIRFYVDEIMRTMQPENKTDEKINTLLSKDDKQEAILERAVRLIREITQMTAVITLPAFKKRKLKNLKLIRMDSSRLLMVLVSDEGDARPVELKNNRATQAELDELADVLLKEFQYKSIEEIDIRKLGALRQRNPRMGESIDYLIPRLKEGMKEFDNDHVLICGVDQLLQHGRFETMHEAKQLLSFFEDPANVRMLLEWQGDGTQIRIGREIKDKRFEHLSIIRTPYHYSAQDKGYIAVIGSIRMDYSKILYVLETVKETIDKIFSGIHL